MAATLGLLLATLGCTRPIDADEPVRDRRPIVADDSVIHAFDTELEDRLIDRIELDTFLRDREIYVEVIDGIVHITGEVWTPLERQRVGAIVRSVAGVVDVVNELVVQPHD
jgi:osmotically-inducible protein OsmY